MKETLEDPSVTLEYVETLSQAADIFTKDLAPQAWPNALKLLGIDTGGNVISAEIDDVDMEVTENKHEQNASAKKCNVAIDRGWHGLCAPKHELIEQAIGCPHTYVP